MGKSLTVVILLFVLAVGSLGYMHGSLDRDKDQVVINETVLYGDKRAADGLSLDITVQCNYRLFWNTVYTVGEEPTVSTDFEFHQAQKYDGPTGIPFRFYLDSRFGGYGSSTGFRGIDLTGEITPFEDVASRTNPGEERNETVYVEDYYDFYPIRVGIDGPARIGINEDNQRLFNEFFKIPVHPEHRVAITIRKDEAGNVRSIGLGMVRDADVYFVIQSVATENDCFFTVSPQTTDGKLLDTSFVPGGYGIYHFPRNSREQTLNTLATDDLRNVFSIDAAKSTVAALETSTDGSKLLLVTEEDGVYMLTVIDAKTFEELQKLKVLDVLGEDAQKAILLGLFVHDDFMVFMISDGRLVLFDSDEIGHYRIKFFGDLAQLDELRYILYRPAAMDYNGEQLVIAATQDGYFSPRYCSFYLAVFSATGLVYAGYYEHNLDLDLSDIKPCRPVDRIPVRVSWNN